MCKTGLSSTLVGLILLSLCACAPAPHLGGAQAQAQLRTYLAPFTLERLSILQQQPITTPAREVLLVANVTATYAGHTYTLQGARLYFLEEDSGHYHIDAHLTSAREVLFEMRANTAPPPAMPSQQRKETSKWPL